MSVSYKKTKLACYTGLTVQAIINNFLPILFIIFQRDYGLNYEQLGRLLFINFAIQIFADFITPYIVKFIGYKGSAIICHFLAAFGLSLLFVLPSIMTDFYSAVVISVIVYAFSSGILEVVMSPIMELIPEDNKTANMAFLHSFYCWGQALTVIVTTLLVKLLGFADWSFIPLLWAIIPFLNMFFFMRVPFVEPPKTQNEKTSKDFIKKREFLCFLIFMLCAGANEIAMSEWASVFAQNALGVSKTIGDLTGPCAFAILMGSGRII
jgi:fucose permease